jgi:hypothetical protein
MAAHHTFLLPCSIVRAGAPVSHWSARDVRRGISPLACIPEARAGVVVGPSGRAIDGHCDAILFPMAVRCMFIQAIGGVQNLSIIWV